MRTEQDLVDAARKATETNARQFTQVENSIEAIVREAYRAGAERRAGCERLEVERLNYDLQEARGERDDLCSKLAEAREEIARLKRSLVGGVD